MSFQVETDYRQGSGKRNEDAVVVRPDIGLFAVIDGATALHADEKLSGAVAAQAVKSSLEHWDGHGHLIDAVYEANRRLREATGGNKLEKSKRPSCCIAAVRWQSSGLEFAQTGDCMLFIEYPNADIRQVTHDSVAKYDTESIEAVVAAWHKRESKTPAIARATGDEQLAILADIRSEVLPLIANHREMMNVSGGYSVLDGSAEAEQYIEHGKLNGSLAASVLLLSDGLQLPDYKVTAEKGWLTTAKHAFQHGAKQLAEMVEQLERSDLGCRIYPRLKPHDDKSAVLVRASR